MATRQIVTGKPYPLKALITWGSNPILWAPHTRHTFEALSSQS